MAVRHLQLTGTDADWYEREETAIETRERHNSLLLAYEIASTLKDSPADTTAVAQTEAGTVLRIEPQHDGKVVVKILGNIGGVRAAFSFKPNYAKTIGHEPDLTELTWELDATHSDEPIEELDLQARYHNRLKREGIHTVGQLLAKTDFDLLDIRNFGNEGIAAVNAAIAARGLKRRR